MHDVTSSRASEFGDEAAARRLLEARARIAARPAVSAESEDVLEVLSFSLGGERYAVETCYVAEVRELAGLTSLPGAPSFLAGVTSLRGRVLAVIDLGALFGLPEVDATDSGLVIVLRGGGTEFGLLTCSVGDVMAVPVATLGVGGPIVHGPHERFFKGFTLAALAVLDGARLLADDALKVGGQTPRQGTAR